MHGYYDAIAGAVDFLIAAIALPAGIIRFSRQVGIFRHRDDNAGIRRRPISPFAGPARTRGTLRQVSVRRNRYGVAGILEFSKASVA